MSMNVVPGAQSAVQGLIPMVKMETGPSVEGPWLWVFIALQGISLGSYRGLKSEVVKDFRPKFTFFQKKTPCGEMCKILFQKHSSRHRRRGDATRTQHCGSCVQISWNREIWRTGSRWNRALFTGEKKTHKILPRSRFCADRTQNLPGPAQTMYSECHKFPPNRFTSGGVIGECVNAVKTRHKVNAILGEAIASRRVGLNITIQ